MAEWTGIAIALVPAWPALGALLLGALSVRTAPRERTVGRISQLSLWLAAAGVAVGWIALAANGFCALELSPGHWFSSHAYGFPLVFHLDGLALATASLVALLTLATCRFSVGYLHREPGFLRFFLLTLVFSAGMYLLVLGGSYDLLFAGWEMVGLTSVLLVGFFQERNGPVKSSVRVLVTYRLCDVGLLLAAALLHAFLGTTAFATVFPHAHALPLALVGFALLFAAMGKSAQFPVGGWLPRAMEGPTASSAVFYGSLSVHAGVYLLIRSWPLFEGAPSVRIAMVVIGALTALTGTASSKVRADAKTGLAYATLAQLGLMLVEVGAGLPRLATVHLLAHAILRYYQFLRTPSALQDVLEQRAALGVTAPDEAAALFGMLSPARRRWLYRLAVERFGVEQALERWLVRPILRGAERLDALESGPLSWTGVAPPPPAPPELPLEGSRP